MDYGNFLDACQSLASSAGELASLLVVVLLSYLLVVVRSLVAKVKLLVNPTSSPFASAPVPRARRARAPRSSASPTALAVSPNPQPSRKEVDSHGVSQEVPPLSPVERFVQSIPEAELFRGQTPLDGGSANHPNSVGRAESAAGGRSDDRGSDDGGGSRATGSVLAAKRAEIAG